MPNPLGAFSLWRASTPLHAARPPVRDRLHADVVIVGGGFTGLWTAYYLAEADPALKIVVVEREYCGYGASGRNGGWCSALFPASWATLAAMSDRSGAQRMQHAMDDSVDEVGRILATEGIVGDFVKGGTITLARTPVQLERAVADFASSAAWGFDSLKLLDAVSARARLNATGVLGGTFTPDCARIHPLRAVRGLADAVERRGVRIYENSAVLEIQPHRVVTSVGSVDADFVVRATEGYTAGLPGQRRAIAPVYSLMIATEPLPESVWDEIGLREFETFSDYRHLIIYGQRTADGRLAFGGRGAPYHFGSRIRPSYDRNDRVFSVLAACLLELFPVLAGFKVTHRWGGPLGIARDWCASVSLDRDTGMAQAGGYVGDGVSTTNLAGRTLRDLILDRRTPLTSLPWVGHQSGLWEPEPLRWLGANAGLRAMTAADREEALTGRSSRLARMMSRFTGGH